MLRQSKIVQGIDLPLTTLTEKEVAEVLQCSVACLRRMRREGRGPKWTKVGRLVRYSEHWVTEYLEANSIRGAEMRRDFTKASAPARTES